MRTYGILRFKADAYPIAIRYSTKERRDAAAQRYADRDHWVVGTEEFIGRDWWLDGVVVPTNCTHEHETTEVATFPAGPARAVHTCQDCGANLSELLES